MLFPLRLSFRWLAKWTRSIEKGPTPFFMTMTLLFVFLCAFMTDIIGERISKRARACFDLVLLGVHAIFGAFIMGLIIVSAAFEGFL